MVKDFLIQHQEKREKARDVVEDFLVDDKLNIDVSWKE